MREALVYEKLSGDKVRCGVCQRGCVIAEGKTGFCLSKLNKEGKLYALNYGLVRGIQVDPIEKKPFYHFCPGEMVPSIGSWGCNFRCKQCLNWRESWGEPATSILKRIAKDLLPTKNSPNEYFGGPSPLSPLSPQAPINKIKSSGYQGIAFTYNEPVIWAEYVLDVAKLAKKQGFFTVFVTNGSWTKETLDKIGPFIDAANVDLKGFSAKTYARQGAFFGKIPQMMKYAQEKHNILIEITTLLIPGINDDPKELRKMTEWIVKNLGPKTPWHLSRYSPDLAPDQKFQKIPPTPVETLKKAAKIGKKAGLEFIYIWAPGRDLPGGFFTQGDTVCPQCGRVAVRRSAWRPDMSGVDKKGKCKKCGEDLNMRLS